MKEIFSRTAMLMGESAINTLAGCKVAVFGVGGVGGYATEVLARSGVGRIDLFDNDSVCLSNINRQIIALHSSLGQLKVDVAAQRIIDINPDCEVHTHPMFYLPENAHEVDLSIYDHVLDCIDTMAAKIELIKQCHAANVPLISSMGAANKMDPTRFKVIDITKTIMDPLAKVIRKKLRTLGIRHLRVVCSDEAPLKPLGEPMEASGRRSTPASNAFVPAAAGLVAGGEVVRYLLEQAGTFRQDKA